jgi:hypothetical protein
MIAGLAFYTLSPKELPYYYSGLSYSFFALIRPVVLHGIPFSVIPSNT